MTCAKETAISELRQMIQVELNKSGIAILPPMEVASTTSLMEALEMPIDTSMLDPWYNKGFGGIQADYHDYFLSIIRRAGTFSQHVFFWGFPEIIAPFVERIPEPLELTSWLTWYYKNNPSVIRGWRSSQNACLHMSVAGAKLYPERFLNDKQLELKGKGKLRYMPGPTSVIATTPDDVIEESLLVGFIGRKEQTGHPSQKPQKVYDQLLRMSVADGGIVWDPMSGSGTTGAVCRDRGFKAILCDGSDEFTALCEKRLGVKRLEVSALIEATLDREHAPA
ncbi:DNA methyltransferase [Thalassospira xiamenensis]|uniref:site-specific DNA-methyltransferase (adenine-specific) n=1 Tax=Thalassospira xiamenensis TaxID=220697 RepID=A0A285TSM3_9PROT|nr:DNA methyltransferase [Thalassospira xiamenensis]SOC26746.1 site-specific DNA-methyltransferase (adenine-specific) [Thalassospira xiamenensis]